ncbi:hypothetical protein [Tunicatimonas pelagia]|uniref:hypothetical protein n=1 Tax=Tunicatimonas pelagia TaxID=931531 RepID=UPI002666E7BB|nr:hypothetical protein [Tunicatimonas pelagia]WKN41004.1 hypothetical protein P0M28_18380 [Tunicatimonas pelagia]
MKPLLFRLLLALFIFSIGACKEDENPDTDSRTNKDDIVLTENEFRDVNFTAAQDTILYQFATNDAGVIEVVAKGSFSNLGVSLKSLSDGATVIENTYTDPDEVMECGPVPAGKYQISLNRLLLNTDASDIELMYV